MTADSNAAAYVDQIGVATGVPVPPKEAAGTPKNHMQCKFL